MAVLFAGTYGEDETNKLITALRNTPHIKDGRVLVIGSEKPWVEACCLLCGAREVVTLEYGKIISEHPQIKTMTPVEFRKAFLDRILGMFDAVVTFSSVEHSGLGRLVLSMILSTHGYQVYNSILAPFFLHECVTTLCFNVFQ